MTATDDAVTYREGGAGDVPAENEAQWRRWAIWPRTLGGVRDPDVSTSIVGLPIALPVVVAPSALHGLWHVEAEAETARGARDGGSALVLSQASTLPPEQVDAGAYLQQL
ncbi:MAG: alpha-hydroxy-acid oxidizing protein, partial [Aeromicrobium sp.]